jgi:hypothetical protein
MNAMQRRIAKWTLIAAAIALHFSFVTWNYNGYVDDELFLFFSPSRAFHGQTVLCILAGLVAPALLIGLGFFIAAGASAPKASPPQTNPQTSKNDP